MGLLPVPRAAFRRAQVGDRLLEFLERPGQRRYVQRRQVGDPVAAVDFIQRHFLDRLRARSRRVKEAHRMLLRILVHQRQLDLAGQRPRIELGHQRVRRRREGRVMPRGKLGRVGHIQPVQRVHAQRPEGRLDEREPLDDPHLQVALLRQAQNLRHGRFTHSRAAGHGVAHALRPFRQAQHFGRDRFVHAGKIVRFLVEGIHRLPGQPRQFVDRRVARGPDPHLVRRGKRFLRLPGEHPRPARSEPDDGYSDLPWSTSKTISPRRREERKGFMSIARSDLVRREDAEV